MPNSHRVFHVQEKRINNFRVIFGKPNDSLGVKLTFKSVVLAKKAYNITHVVDVVVMSWGRLPKI